MKKYNLTPSYDCLILGSDKQVFLQEGQTASFEHPEILSIYPTQNSRTNYAFTLDLNSKQDSQFYKVQDFEEQTYFFLSNAMTCKSYVCFALQLDDDACHMELGENSLEIKYKQFVKKLALAEKFSSYKTGVISKCCYCLLTSKERQNLVIFDTSTGKVQNLVGDDIKINVNNIIFTQTLDNFAIHTLQKEFILTADGLTKKRQLISYQNGRAIVATIPQTVPYAFMEAIACEDFELAFSYLDNDLKHKLDIEHLQRYFGQVINFNALNTTTYLVITKTGKKTISFSLNENKIEEIGEI